MLNPGVKLNHAEVAEDRLKVELLDGRTRTLPIARYPRLREATSVQLANWKIAGAGFGLHWPELDEALSSEGLLRDAPQAR